jgi:hypothetical protein
MVFSASSTPTIGNGIIYGNVFTPAFKCTVDAVGVWVTEAGTTNSDVGSDPNGSPTPIANGTVSIDPQIFSTAANRFCVVTLPAEVTLTAGTAYAVGVKQNSATNISIGAYDVAAAAQWQANGLDSAMFAATSTAGAAFSTLVSGTRRAFIFARVSQIDSGAGSGGNANILRGSVVE